MNNSKRTFKVLSILVAFLFVLSLTFTAFAADVPPAVGEDLEGYKIILHVNDVHGHVDDNMGYSSLKALKDQYMDAGASVIVLDAGDTFHGLPIATMNQGGDIVTITNIVGFDAMAPGNHDFNYGTDRLIELGGELGYPVLAANVTKDGEPIFEDHLIIDKGGVKYGIFGLATPETAFKTSPKNVEGVTFEDPVEAAKTEVAHLEEEGVDYIIALSHLGVDRASEVTSDMLSAAVPEIDIIVDGHSHTAMADGEVADGSIELVPHDGLIASTGAYIQNIGVISIAPDGEISAGLLDAGEENPDAYLEKDAYVDETIEGIKAELAPSLTEVVATTNVLLDGERENVRAKETNLGDVAADAVRVAGDADFAIINGGGIRASIQEGDITREDVITVFPFGNFLVVKEMPGSAIIELMEHGLSFYPEEAGAFPQISGMTFTFNPDNPAGSRVMAASLEENGQPITSDTMYTVATNDFMAIGGDDYTTFLDYPDLRYGDSFDVILTDYLAANSEHSAEPAGRVAVYEEGASVPDEEDALIAEETVEQAEFAADENEEDAAVADATVDQAEDGTEKDDKQTLTAPAYVVKKGDSLWNIAKKELGDPQRWVDIYKLNREEILFPDVIEIGQVLVLPAA